MRVFAAVLFFLCCTNNARSQFYYQDIVVTGQTNKNYQLLRNTDIRKISATSYDGDEKSDDFILEQTISADRNQLFTRSASINNEESYFLSQFKTGRLIHSVDSNKNAINLVDYSYSNEGKIVQIASTSKDFDGTYTNTESHLWLYSSKGIPEKMIKIRNEKDTTIVLFETDENNNVSEEKWYKKGNLIENYYYYYNDKHLLTDIVRYSVRAKKLLPDYMFEYDNSGHLVQMTQTQGGIASYLVWKYTYNENQLKDVEFVYSKNKTLLGRVEYRYK